MFAAMGWAHIQSYIEYTLISHGPIICLYWIYAYIAWAHNMFMYYMYALIAWAHNIFIY
jgi:hypothetical protein